jgi:hypothetical protein
MSSLGGVVEPATKGCPLKSSKPPRLLWRCFSDTLPGTSKKKLTRICWRIVNKRLHFIFKSVFVTHWTKNPLHMHPFFHFLETSKNGLKNSGHQQPVKDPAKRLNLALVFLTYHFPGTQKDKHTKKWCINDKHLSPCHL